MKTLAEILSSLTVQDVINKGFFYPKISAADIREAIDTAAGIDNCNEVQK